MTQTDLNCRGGGGILLIGCGLHDSHIIGPIRGRVEAHATTRPGAHRSGRPGKPGELVGGPGAFKWYPELGRSQGVPAPGRWTRDRWGPQALGGPTKCLGSSQARPGARVRAGQGAVGLQVPLGPSSGAGRGLTRGPRGLLPPWRDPGPVTLSRVGRIRPSLTPGRISGPRGQGPGRTNPGPGKPQAALRIQNAQWHPALSEDNSA